MTTVRRGRCVACDANEQLREIKSALSHAVDAGWWHTNPLWRWKAMQVSEPDKRVRVAERDGFARMLETAAVA